jgi:DNA-binding Xre family transcriptional regulator
VSSFGLIDTFDVGYSTFEVKVERNEWMIKSKLKTILADREMTLKELQSLMQAQVGAEKKIHYTTLRRFADNPDRNGRIGVEFLDMICDILQVEVGQLFVHVDDGG